MRPDRLAELLQRADRAAGVPRVVADLERRVRATTERRRRGRRLAIWCGSGAAAAVLAITIRLTGGLHIGGDAATNGASSPGGAAHVTTALSADEVLRLRAEIARLDADADSRLHLLARTEALTARLSQHDAQQHVLTAPDVLAEATRQLETAAYVTLWHGERLERAAAPAAAAAVYRDAISIFPATSWAEVARRRLNQIEHRSGESG